jgi:hypothetical protein
VLPSAAARHLSQLSHVDKRRSAKTAGSTDASRHHTRQVTPRQPRSGRRAQEQRSPVSMSATGAVSPSSAAKCSGTCRLSHADERRSANIAGSTNASRHRARPVTPRQPQFRNTRRRSGLTCQHVCNRRCIAQQCCQVQRRERWQWRLGPCCSCHVLQPAHSCSAAPRQQP